MRDFLLFFTSIKRPVSLKRHYAFPRGWLFNTGWTVSAQRPAKAGFYKVMLGPLGLYRPPFMVNWTCKRRTQHVISGSQSTCQFVGLGQIFCHKCHIFIFYYIDTSVTLETGVRAREARGLHPLPSPAKKITQFFGPNAHDSVNDS